ncbi:hypothetical protein GZL_02163 [Streptomyces sp. 769]|nr:hypothetical protein GZL_02163 [Streptomyces sp. 769]
MRDVVAWHTIPPDLGQGPDHHPRLQPPHMYLTNRNSFATKDVTITFSEGSDDVAGVEPARSICHLTNFTKERARFALHTGASGQGERHRRRRRPTWRPTTAWARSAWRATVRRYDGGHDERGGGRGRSAGGGCSALAAPERTGDRRQAWRHFGDDRYGEAAVRAARSVSAAVDGWESDSLYFGLTGLALALRDHGRQLLACRDPVRSATPPAPRILGQQRTVLRHSRSPGAGLRPHRRAGRPPRLRTTPRHGPPRPRHPRR